MPPDTFQEGIKLTNNGSIDQHYTRLAISEILTDKASSNTGNVFMPFTNTRFMVFSLRY